MLNSSVENTADVHRCIIVYVFDQLSDDEHLFMSDASIYSVLLGLS